MKIITTRYKYNFIFNIFFFITFYTSLFITAYFLNDRQEKNKKLSWFIGFVCNILLIASVYVYMKIFKDYQKFNIFDIIFIYLKYLEKNG